MALSSTATGADSGLPAPAPVTESPNMGGWVDANGASHPWTPSTVPQFDPTTQTFTNTINVTPSADDYNNFIQGDPGYLALSNALNANSNAWNSAMRGAIQKAVLNSGYAIPEASQYLDAGMSDQAANNPYSQKALLSQAHSNALRAIQNALAARGGYDSGELTYGVGNEQQNYNLQDLKARGSLLDYINNLQSQGAQMANDNAAKLATELGNATQRQLALHPVGASVAATWNDATGTYVDAQGNHYDPTGRLVATSAESNFTPPTGTAPTPTGFASTPPSYNTDPTQYGVQGPTNYNTPGLIYNSSQFVPNTPSNDLLRLPV